MQPTLTVFATVGGAATAGLFGLIVALLSGRTLRQQTRLQHKLDLQDHVREEQEDLYRDLLAWGFKLTADLAEVRECQYGPRLVSVLAALTPSG
jgi:hypothetical protein